MIPRTKRKPRNASLLAYKRRAPTGIPRTIKATKRAKRATRRAVIAATRAKVWLRDGACRYSRNASETDEMHEVVSRAKLRGRPPDEIFNTRNCLRLARAVHERVTRGQLRIEFLDVARGCNASVEFHDQNGNIWVG
jgi:hypothetical protein